MYFDNKDYFLTTTTSLNVCALLGSLVYRTRYVVREGHHWVVEGGPQQSRLKKFFS